MRGDLFPPGKPSRSAQPSRPDEPDQRLRALTSDQPVRPVPTDQPTRPAPPSRPTPTTGRAVVRGWLRTGWGVALGGAWAVVELLFLLAAGSALVTARVVPPARRVLLRPVGAGAVRLAEADRRRLARYLGHRTPAVPQEGGHALRYICVRSPLGLLGGAVVALLVYGLVTAGALVVGWWIDAGISTTVVLLSIGPGVVLLYLACQGIHGVAVLELRVAVRFLGPTPHERLRRRISELAASRTEIVAAVDNERRRIERDLHDGVQQRIVALGMLIGRARRIQDPDRAAELLRQAHEEAGHLLVDLREVSWRVFPVALDEGGLGAALETVVERSAIPVRLTFGLGERPPAHVETAAYFIVCEAVTNAVKHSGAAGLEVSVTTGPRRPRTVLTAGTDTPETVVVRVSDDGSGGADPDGPGLSGLARRVAALDGTFRVDSPPDGPTLIVAELPCA